MNDDAERGLLPGWVAIVAVAVVAVGASVGAWWYHANQQREAIAFWGPDRARLVVQAPQVELLKLAPDGKLHVGAARPPSEHVAAQKDITHARGVSHVRAALVHGGSFEPPSTGAAEEPEWDYALYFTDASDPAVALTVLISTKQRLIATDRGQARLVQATIDGLNQFFAEQFAQ